MGAFEKKIRKKNRVTVQAATGIHSGKEKMLVENAFTKGYETGEQDGVKKAIDYMSEKIHTLHEIKGVGQKTVDAVANHFGFEILENKGEEK